MVEFSLPQIGLEVGGGALIGAVIGFAAKKIAKLVAIIIGLELALFKFLETRGILSVNWDAISGAAGNATAAAGEGGAQVNSWVMSILSTLPVGAGFTGGFLLAFKKA
ncbi:FUN14 domain-containing protein [Halorhabdus amylolytica]|uniref:FUN14 domain-containing protein n=1 Tax=Halorhabdus amylolytica TaxID=2559573 RepID=UPI0010AB3B5D|nr:FUN14 domain-containing protein [Halorhabdus amylolytica]